MYGQISTLAFVGIEARPVEVQVRITPGRHAFVIVGLPDKAVAESRERVRGALNAIGLALPPKRITVNLAPADLPKEGSHYDLPIALGLMAAVGAIARDAIEGYCVLGELALDGSIATVAGALPAAIAIDDTTSMLLKFDSGITGYLATVFVTGVLWRLHVAGTKGWLEIRDSFELTACGLQGAPQKVTMPAINLEQATLEAFADAVSAKQPFVVPPENAVNGIAVLEAIVASAASASAIAID